MDATVPVGFGDGDREQGSTQHIAAPSERYVVLEHLGRGATGSVERAYDSHLHRDVALKRIVDPRPNSFQRLRQEAQALARLNHSNVVAVYDIVRHVKELYIAMEYVRGTNLSAWLKTSPSRAQRFHKIMEAGNGLAAAHRAGVVHRDFKPANVLIGDDGRVCVCDFGLAKDAPTEDSGPTSYSIEMETPSILSSTV